MRNIKIMSCLFLGLSISSVTFGQAGMWGTGAYQAMPQCLGGSGGGLQVADGAVDAQDEIREVNQSLIEAKRDIRDKEKDLAKLNADIEKAKSGVDESFRSDYSEFLKEHITGNRNCQDYDNAYDENGKCKKVEASAENGNIEPQDHVSIMLYSMREVFRSQNSTPNRTPAADSYKNFEANGDDIVNTGDGEICYAHAFALQSIGQKEPEVPLKVNLIPQGANCRDFYDYNAKTHKGHNTEFAKVLDKYVGDHREDPVIQKANYFRISYNPGDNAERLDSTTKILPSSPPNTAAPLLADNPATSNDRASATGKTEVVPTVNAPPPPQNPDGTTVKKNTVDDTLEDPAWPSKNKSPNGASYDGSLPGVIPCKQWFYVCPPGTGSGRVDTGWACRLSTTNTKCSSSLTTLMEKSKKKRDMEQEITRLKSEMDGLTDRLGDAKRDYREAISDARKEAMEGGCTECMMAGNGYVARSNKPGWGQILGGTLVGLGGLAAGYFSYDNAIKTNAQLGFPTNPANGMGYPFMMGMGALGMYGAIAGGMNNGYGCGGSMGNAGLYGAGGMMGYPQSMMPGIMGGGMWNPGAMGMMGGMAGQGMGGMLGMGMGPYGQGMGGMLGLGMGLNPGLSMMNPMMGMGGLGMGGLGMGGLGMGGLGMGGLGMGGLGMGGLGMGGLGMGGLGMGGLGMGGLGMGGMGGLGMGGGNLQMQQQMMQMQMQQAQIQMEAQRRSMQNYSAQATASMGVQNEIQNAVMRLYQIQSGSMLGTDTSFGGGYGSGFSTGGGFGGSFGVGGGFGGGFGGYGGPYPAANNGLTPR